MKIFDLKNISIDSVSGIGENFARKLSKSGIKTVYDLLMLFPRSYDDRSNPVPIAKAVRKEGKATVEVEVLRHEYFYSRRWGRTLKVVIFDGMMTASLLCYNRNFLKDVLRVGRKILVSGKFVLKDNAVECSDFEYEILNGKYSDKSKGIVPIYREIGGISSKLLRKFINSALKEYLKVIEEHLPDYLIKKRKLVSIHKALKDIHFPQTVDDVRKARARFIYDEFFRMELLVAVSKNEFSRETKNREYADFLSEKFLKSLPFELTSAQKRVIEEIKKDMLSQKVMHRLLQGDVGSGKTVVAIYSMLMAVSGGYQAVLMAPTEILAEQHYERIVKYLQPLGIRVSLVKGETSKRRKKDVLKSVKAGESEIIVGTHALIYGVQFKNLGMVVIDEQHRFGVVQRLLLREKGMNPDTLVMTATPIPRTLAMTVYGNLDVSVIDEMPAGRKPPKTKWVKRDDIGEVYDFLFEKLSSGEKVFYICPLIDESDKLNFKSIVEAEKELRGVFEKFGIVTLHGRMSSDEKKIIMERFRSGDVKLLITTSVVEVGVDVPDANVMVIDGAERFGLAQLHQLRGRIGRGGGEAWCFLITDGWISREAVARMRAMEKYTDGFKIADIDLKLRGPGEVLGTKQSGVPTFRFGNPVKDVKILETARNDAFFIVEKDPELSKTVHLPLRDLIQSAEDKLMKA